MGDHILIADFDISKDLIDEEPRHLSMQMVVLVREDTARQKFFPKAIAGDDHRTYIRWVACKFFFFSPGNVYGPSWAIGESHGKVHVSTTKDLAYNPSVLLKYCNG